MNPNNLESIRIPPQMDGDKRERERWRGEGEGEREACHELVEIKE